MTACMPGLWRLTLQRSKTQSYLGFAIKSGNLRSGVNAISTLKRADALILCATASPNTVKDAEKLSAKFGCPLIVSNIAVEQLIGKENCKLLAVTDANLAKAILNNLDDNFTLKSGGCKE